MEYGSCCPTFVGDIAQMTLSWHVNHLLPQQNRQKQINVCDHIVNSDDMNIVATNSKSAGTLHICAISHWNTPTIR